MGYAILVLKTTTPQWLSLSREQRNQFNREVLHPIFKKYEKTVQARWFDAEAFTARCTDFALFETEDLKQFYFLMEELRDTLLFTKPYMILNDIIVGLEDGYKNFEKSKI